jgi:uncharacterized protein YqeY
MLQEKINQDINEAMKARDTNKLTVLRTLKGELQREGKELQDSQVISIVKKAIEGIRLTTNSQDEINILECYLPQQLTAEQIEATIRELIGNANRFMNLGQIMGYFKQNFSGQYDGQLVSQLAKGVLTVTN